MSTSVAARVQSIVVKNLDVSEDEVTVEARLLHDLGADELDLVKLRMDLEENFDINFPNDADEIFLKFETVGELIEYVQGQIDAAGTGSTDQ